MQNLPKVPGGQEDGAGEGGWVVAHKTGCYSR